MKKLKLFTPEQTGSIHIENRIVMAPHDSLQSNWKRTE
jgi:2,4-dienoyl-CoA reductase-like NADH-dependent reductase (Old Yellow Enzyme family)